MKRIICALLSMILLLAVMLCSCATDSNNTTDDPAPGPDESPNADPANPGDTNNEVFSVLGLIINDDASNSAYMTMYGFLHMAENLGYAAKIYRVATTAEGLAAVDAAVLEGVDGMMVFDPSGTYRDVIEKAAQTRMYVVVPYYPTDVANVDSNIIADEEEYYDELARGIAERMTERSLKTGRLLVYGRDTAHCYSLFSASIAGAYPQFTVSFFNRSALDEQGAIDELANYLLYNRDVKGMYVVDDDLASVAVKARAQAIAEFKKGIPEVSETPVTPAPGGATPSPTPNPGLLTSILVTLFCNGLSDENYALFSGNDIYALCIEPYYEAAAQGTMALDKCLNGNVVQSVSKVNRPIVYGETVNKYKAIYDQVKKLFALEETS